MASRRGGARGLLRQGHRDEHRPQAQGDAPRDRRREALHEERDPAGLPEHRRLRRHGVRHRGGGQLLLQHLRRQPLAGAGGIAHGDREQPREVPAGQARQRDERRRERVRGQHHSTRLHPHEHAEGAEDHAGGVRHGDRHARAARDHRAQHRLPDGRRQRVLLRLREEHPADRFRLRRGRVDPPAQLPPRRLRRVHDARPRPAERGRERHRPERAADLPRLGRRRRDLERAGRHRPGARHGPEPHVQPGPGGAAGRTAVHEHQLQHRLRLRRLPRLPARAPRTRCSRSPSG